MSQIHQNMSVNAISNSVEQEKDKNPGYDRGVKKKSGFQITRVITKSNGSDIQDGEIDDDADEANTESFNISNANDTDFDQHSDDTVSSHSVIANNEDVDKVSINFPGKTQSEYVNANGPAMSPEPVAEATQIVPQREKPTESRFKVVKIESKEPFRRGRWSCQDFLDPHSSDKNEKSGLEEATGNFGSGNSSTSSSFHFVPGVDDPVRNPLIEGQSGDIQASSSVIYSNGTHIGQNTVLPSQIPNHVPSGGPQTHNQFGTAQSLQLQTSVGNVSASQSQQSFSQSSMPSQGVGGTPQTSVHNDSTSSALAAQALHMNAQQPPQESSNISSSRSQEFSNNVQSNLVAQQTLDARTVNVNSDNVMATHSDFNGPEMGYNSLGSTLDATGAHSEVSDQESVESDIRYGMSLLPPMFELATKINHADKDDESGASTVAIDNKIEQAMDLVKSHLMYAVREEVEVLREQIKDLMEKNAQLENENSVLRKAASPETLNHLQKNPRTTPGPQQITAGPDQGLGGATQQQQQAAQQQAANVQQQQQQQQQQTQQAPQQVQNAPKAIQPASNQQQQTQQAVPQTQGHPGVTQGHPGVSQGHPGVCQGHPGVSQGHPGGHAGVATQGHTGVNQDHHGVNQGHPGVTQGHGVTAQGHAGIPQAHAVNANQTPM